MKKSIQVITLLALSASIAYAQVPQHPNDQGCLVSSRDLTGPDSALIREQQAFEKFTADFIQSGELEKSIAANNCYVFPVVFHVYGTTQGGMPVNDSIIIDAVNKLNIDFHGLNSDYNTVHNSFLGIRSYMPDVTFALAQIDPNGDPTTGIVYHPVAAGYANSSGYDAAIEADAWDNYMYMNIYIMNDLFNNGVTNNSGYGYYPSSTMSDNNTARIVYNGAYLGVNCNSWQPEFASTLTHEYGHWLNLIHTFDGGCVSPNDMVNDTPPCDYSNVHYGCHPNNTANSPLNCNNNLINAENYMDYAGAYGCYKMFTQGQVARMYAAVQHPSRQPLWQTSNLIATGLDQLCSTAGVNTYASSVCVVYPNPSHGTVHVQSPVAVSKAWVTDISGREIYHYSPASNAEKTFSIDLTTHSAGVYFLYIQQENSLQTYKLVIE